MAAVKPNEQTEDEEDRDRRNERCCLDGERKIQELGVHLRVGQTKRLISHWVYVAGTPVVGEQRGVGGLQECLVLHCVDVAGAVRVLAEVEGLVEDLVLPHVQVQDDHQEDDAVVEPLAGHVHRPVLPPQAARQPDVDRRRVHARKLDVQVALETREIPVLPETPRR